MTDTINIIPHNAAYVKLDGEYHLLSMIDDHFTFKVPGAQFMPAFKQKIWDGKIHAFSVRTRLLPIGLIPRLESFCTQLGDVDIEYDVDHQKKFNVTFDELRAYATSLNIHSQGKPITPHDYQIDAVLQSLNEGRLVALAPTSAGKSLIIYMYLNYILDHSDIDEKMMLIVPSNSLVHQMVGDFKDYRNNGDDSWRQIDEFVHLNLAGNDKLSDKPITISTWQSLQNFAKGKKTKSTAHIDGAAYLATFTTVVVDETHTAKGIQLQNILNQMTNAYTRLGVTGTLDGTDLTQISLEGIFGKVYQVITTKELMDMGAVSEMRVKIVMLEYPQDLRKMLANRKDDNGKKRSLTYQEEIDYIVSLPERLKFIKNLAVKLTGNTMILVNLKEKQGTPLYNMIRDAVPPERKVFYISGDMDGKERDEIRHIVDKEDDAIIIATYQTCQQGVSIRRLHNVVFAAPSKSQIRVLQSIGRGLRKGDGKTHCTLFDIADDLSWKSNKNHTLKHAIERIKMYATVQFDYKMSRIPFAVKWEK